MSLGTLGLAFLAGALSILSPCVLPLLPIVLGSAATEHRLAPFALAAGLALSFVGIGLFVATVGFAAGLDATVFRTVSAVLLIGIGMLLLVPQFGAQAAAAAGPVSNWVETRFGGFNTGGVGGQFLLGILLGAVWSPLRRTDPRGRFDPCREGRKPRPSRTHNGRVRGRSCAASDRRRIPVARGIPPLARQARRNRKRWEGRAWRPSPWSWTPDRDRARQAPRDVACRRVSRLAHRAHNPVLRRASPLIGAAAATPQQSRRRERAG